MDESFALKRSVMRCMAGVSLALSLATANSALAVPITYSFTTDNASAVAPSPLASAFAGLNVSGSFVYDSAGPLLASMPSGSYYGGFSALNGSVGTHSFADIGGLIVVQNDTYAPPFPPGLAFDLLQLGAEVPNASSPTYDLTGFSIDGYTLLNVRMFWIETIIGGAPDFLGSSDLPASLPTISGRLALDFVPSQYAPINGQPVSQTLVTSVFFDGLSASPAPVPDTNSLSLLALGMLGIIVARRRLKLA